MSLKIIKRPDSAYWQLIGTINGRRIRESTGTTVRRRAEEYRAKRESEIWQASIYGEKSVITFSHAVAAYLEAEERHSATKAYLARLLEFFRNTKLLEINQARLDEAYRAVLIKGMASSPATKKRAVNTPVSAVMRFAAQRGWCELPAFAPVRMKEKSVPFLYPDEVIRLISSAAEHLKPLLIFLVGTGARSSEALELEWNDVDLKGRRAVLWQKQGNQRHIDLPPVVMKALSGLPHRSERVFVHYRNGTERRGLAYHDNSRTSGGQFKRGWAGACERAGLPGRYREWVPKGEVRERRQFVPEHTPHALRHTWASWHYCLHHDLLLLKEEGGWGTIRMVERYSKLVPDVYKDEIRQFLAGSFLSRN